MIESNDKNRKQYSDDDEDGQGGSHRGGALEFHDFIGTGRERLTKVEERQLLAAHQETHQALVEKQKKSRDDRQALKEGKGPLLAHGLSGAGQQKSLFAEHPILGKAAEFDGVDPQVNLDPTKNEIESNPEKKLELQQALRLKFENQPHFNPKPSPF